VLASYVYPLPFWLHGSNWYQKVLGGWQVSGVTTVQTGLPFNVTIQPDQAGIGFSGSQHPNLVGDALQTSSRGQYLNPTAFALPAPGQFSNLGAYAIYSPFFSNWDTSLQKLFPITERVQAKFSAELYNFPNHLSYTTVSSTVGSANFGQITGATDPRTLQLALRLAF
jgi:hypothetical protein